jgi:hypothetical protein
MLPFKMGVADVELRAALQDLVRKDRPKPEYLSILIQKHYHELHEWDELHE